jgi:hypothetical protein
MSPIKHLSSARAFSQRPVSEEQVSVVQVSPSKQGAALQESVEKTGEQDRHPASTDVSPEP